MSEQNITNIWMFSIAVVASLVSSTLCMYEKTVPANVTTDGFMLKNFEEDAKDLVFDTADAWNITRPFVFSYLGFKMKSLFATKSYGSAPYRQMGFLNLSRGQNMIKFLSKYSTDTNGIYVFMDNSHLANVIQQISKTRFPSHIFKWILVCHLCPSSDIDSYLSTLNGIITLISSSSAPYGDVWRFRLIEVQSHGYGQFLRKNVLGHWDRNGGLPGRDAQPTFGLSGTLNGVTLNVRLLTMGTVEHDLLFQRHLLDVLQSDLNFTIHESVGLKRDFGRLMEDGSFSGVIGEFINDPSMDILAHDISVTNDRSAVLDFSSPIHYTHLGLLYKKPKLYHENSVLIYASPFSLGVWFMILSTCFVFAAALKLFSVAEHILYDHSDVSESQSVNDDICFTVLSMMTGQGGDQFLSKTSSAVLITTFGMFSMIVAASYSAVLNSYFTVMSSMEIVKDLDALILQPGYQIGISETFLDTFKGHPNLKHIEALLRKDHRNIIKPGELGKAVDRIFREKFVLIESSHVLNQVPDLCRVNFVRLLNAKLYTRHWSFQKNSPYRRIISRRINKLKSTGVLSHLEDNFFKTERSLRQCPEEESDKPQLELQQVYALFGIIALGAILAIIYLFVEKVATMYFRKSNRVWPAASKQGPQALHVAMLKSIN